MRNLCNKEPNKHCLDKDDQINKSHLARPERPKENLRYTNVWPYAIAELESILDNSNCSSRNLPLYFHQTASK